MSVRSRWHRLVQEFGSGGLALMYAAHRLLNRATGGRVAIVPYLLVAQPIGTAPLSDGRSDVSTRVERVGPGHPLLPSFPRPGDVLARRFSSGAECYAATVKGEFAGHIWIARGRFSEDEVRCVYTWEDAASSVWDFDVYVVPRLRLGRTLSRLWSAVDASLSASGVQWTFSRINRFNTASVKAHLRLGALEVGRLVFVTIGRLQLTWRPGQLIPRPSWGPGSAPVIRLKVPGGRAT